MSATPRQRGHATVDDFLAIPEDERFHELLGGEIVQKASPGGEHGGTQVQLSFELVLHFGYGPRGRGPSGWWFTSETEIRFGDDVCRPDLAGFRKERVPERPRGALIQIVPDWIGEILSEGNRRNDLVRKKHIYHLHRVAHYWIVDPSEETLFAYRWSQDGYIEVIAAGPGERVRAEPFHEMELSLDVIFGRASE